MRLIQILDISIQLKRLEMKFEVEISDEAFQLLKAIEKNGHAEYRDTEYRTLEDFKNSEEYKSGSRTVEWFESRNFSGTYYLIPELTRYNLVDNDFDAWHLTYEVTDLGKEMLGQNEDFIYTSNGGKVKLGEKYFTVNMSCKIEEKVLSEMIKIENSMRYFKDENSAKDFIRNNTFISEDGVKYFYGIYMEEKPIYCVDHNFRGVDTHYGYFPGMDDEYLKYFADKSKAEEFLRMNKPCLSLIDVLPYINETGSALLAELVVNKIKN